MGRGGRVPDVRQLAALMITDMVGFTRMSQQAEATALRLLSEHNDVVRESVAAHGGREVKQTGDGFLVEFPSALQAVSCAIDIQRQLHDRNARVEQQDRFEIRIGLHVGDVVHREGDVFGDGVNITSRIEPVAPPGGISLSQSVQALVRTHIDRPLQSLGPKDLNNVDLPMEVYRVILPWEDPEDRSATEEQKLDQTRLAVLPLANISQQAEDAYFADGMTEELIYTLSRIPTLRIIAQTSVMAYRGTKKTAKEIGRELNVGSILEGSVRKSGSRVRITVQLVDAATEEHLWSERYDRELVDVFEIQSEISTEVAKGLKALMHAASNSGALEKPTERLDAYTEYLKGRHFWNRRTKMALRQALEHFEHAVRVDPAFARAWSGIADCYTVLANHGYESCDVALPKAKQAALRALELDPYSAEAHASLGLAYQQFESDLQAAEGRFKESIRLNPSYATARQWYSGMLHEQMRFDEALEHALKAIDLDPMAHMMHANAAALLSDMGRYDEAAERYRRAIELEPDYEGAYAELAAVHMTLWNWSGAEGLLHEALERNPSNAQALVSRARLLAARGCREEALDEVRRALDITPRSTHVIDQAAQVLRLVGSSDEAIELFEQLRVDKSGVPSAALILPLAYLDMIRLDDARRVLREDEAAGKTSVPALAFWHTVLCGVVDAASGDHVAAGRRVAEIAGYGRLNSQHSAQAMILLLMGKPDEAFARIDEAITVHDPLLLNLCSDPLFAAHRTDPRFLRVLAVMGLANAGNSM